jgi:SAM-dependent methyltransferase
MMAQSDVETLYRKRFSEADEAKKEAVWREVCAFLQRYVSEDAAVIDVACDRGHFIRNIRAREKWASDIRDVSAYLPRDVRFLQANGLSLTDELEGARLDVAFMSNYLEHLPSGEAVVKQLEVANEILKPHGRVLVLLPNIRLVGAAYWDFIDHKVALTDKSLVEAAELAGFRTLDLIRRFLPYTTKSRLPQQARLVRAYLAFRPAWFVFGKQTLFVGEKS